MKIKRLVILVIAVTFISMTIYIYRPIHFNKDFFNSDSITINYLIDNTIENGTIIPNSQSKKFNNYSTNFHKLVHIFDEYSYHNCIHTLTGESSIKNISSYFCLFSKDQIIYISDTPHIIIDDKVYRVGYWGDAKINNLIGVLKDLLKN